MSTAVTNRIDICRVYTPPKIKQGLWILVDRLWPRGLKKDALAFDLWLKEISPSNNLRKWFHENPDERWSEFVNQYIEELDHNAELIEQLLEQVKHKSITLFYAAKDQKHNHAIILHAVLNSWPQKPTSIG